MPKHRVILSTSLWLLLGSGVAVASPPWAPRNQTPLVVLSPQIEELQMTEPVVAPAAAAVSVPGPQEPAILVPRQLFPSARQLFKRLSGTTEPATPATIPQVDSPQPDTSRAVVTISQLEPLPTPLGVIQDPSPELIRPELPPPPGATVSSPECVGCVAEPLEVAPRSHRVGSRLRFPHLSQLLGR